MARFDDETLAKIKSETDIVALIESYGTKLKPRGASGELIGLCPIHDDKSPSLVVNRNKNVWNCLGACGRGGDVIEFVMAAEKTSFRHAVELLDEGKVGAMAAQGTKAANTRRLSSPIAQTAEGAALLADVAAYYHERLKESPDALDYLRKRCIENAEAIEHFKIGFSDRTLGLRLPTNRTKAGKDMRSRLEEVGVLKASGHELMRGCITFPIFAADDHERAGVGEIYGRRIDNAAKSKHFYLPGPHQGVFNAEALTASDEIILCESPIDAVTFWAAGYRNVTACFGTNGFTDDLRKAFRSHDIKRILIAFDSDEAGNNGAERIGKELIDEGYEVFRIRFPREMDANSYAATAAKSGGGESNLHNWMGLVIRNADWIGKGAAPVMTTPVPDFLADARKQIAAKRAEEEAAKEKTVAVDDGQSKSEPQPSSLAADRACEPAKPVAAEPPAASPVPAMQEPQTLDAEITQTGIVMTIGNRVYRVRGLDRNTSIDSMKLNVMVRREDAERFFVDTLDLYAARVRNTFTKEAATELGFDVDVIKRDLGRVLMTLETIQENKLGELEPKDKPIEIDEADRAAAMELLRDPKLVDRVLADFDACGVVGEENNKLVGYLAATSRKLKAPLAVLIQSSSAAGKSSLMEAVLAFMPPEETIKYSAMTGQSLFYMGETNLKHRILAIAEEQGVEQAAYALKLLQSEGQLNIASTGKDPGTGRMETQEYHVEGPVMIFLTTTSDQTDPELKNRCVTLGVCEHAQHTEAIHRQQRARRTLGGRQVGHERQAIRSLHQNAQRCLRPLTVVNNYATQLTFRSDKTKSRRAHDHYLTLIESVTLLHQYQRTEGTFTNEADEPCTFIETTLQDIELANRLADHFLERSFAELPERTQILLEQLIVGLRNLCEFQGIDLWEQRFSRKDVRRWSTFGDTQLKEHLARLVDYEYLRVEAGGGKGRVMEYTLSYDPDHDQTTSIHSGLIDVKQLRSPDNPPSTPDNSAEKSAEVGEKTGEVAPDENGSTRQTPPLPPSSRENDENEQADAA
ncbi:DNA primase [Rubripirellula lacrimiformis]|uniref:DNA primase n=1 Tax=Rubripirellula lacrimiformis TaxID=1930273 RepID=A0A517NJX9_9BACT|nr:DNA primase [Rubripirellula lacrimiformis]QDT07438.1 DNA primase [Rubripirellula lacrimiformis]